MKTIRIGNGCGFWGDSIDAPKRLVRAGKLDYLTLEYLAELTMSILTRQKQKNPQAGFAHDFLTVLRSLVPELIQQPHLKIITNAGGMNPKSCAEQALALLQENNCPRAVGVLSGDDILPHLDQFHAAGEHFTNLDDGSPFESISGKIVSANAYLGAPPIARLLQAGAEIVITGRVADASLCLAPAAHEFGWGWQDWDHLAAGIVAGHLIECGAQATGGLWCNFQEISDFTNIGYPLAELSENGELIITKPEGSGGAVNTETIAEQLLYEVFDPEHYVTPDLIADFSSVRLCQNGTNRVSVLNTRGLPATSTYKVSMAYHDGYQASSTLVILGPEVTAKARLTGQLILDRLKSAGFEFQRTHIEVLGAGDSVPGTLVAGKPVDAVLRIAVHDPDRNKVERFTREIASMVTSGPPGISGYTSGRAAVRDVFAYWPTLVSKHLVDPLVQYEILEK